MKVIENESNDGKHKLSFDTTPKTVTFESANFYCLEDPSFFDHLEEPPCFDHSEKVILEKKANETLRLKSKITTKFFETASKDRKHKPSFDLTTVPVNLEPSYLNYLEKPIMTNIRKNIVSSIS